MLLIGAFYVMTTFLGYGAATIVGRDFITGNGGINMSAPLLAKVLAGDIFFAFISAVAFATILAVVAGLTISASTSFAHDVFVNVIHHGKEQAPGEEVRVARITAMVVGAVSIGVAILLGPGANVAFLVGLAFAVAASANLPVIILSVFWSKFTTRGAVWGLAGGLVSSIVLILLSPDFRGDLSTQEPRHHQHSRSAASWSAGSGPMTMVTTFRRSHAPRVAGARHRPRVRRKQRITRATGSADCAHAHPRRAAVDRRPDYTTVTDASPARMPWALLISPLTLVHFVFLASFVRPAYSAPDADGYYAQARMLVLEGRSDFQPESPAQHLGVHWLEKEDGRFISRYPPGLSIVIGGVWKLFGRDASLYVNAVLASLTLPLVFLLCRPYSGNWLALVGVWVQAADPAANRHALNADSHTLTTFCMVGGLFPVGPLGRRGGALDGARRRFPTGLHSAGAVC